MKSVLSSEDDAILLDTLDPNEIAEKWRDAMGVEVGLSFQSLAAIYHWKCPSTGFCWYSPPEAAGGGELYAQLEKFDWYYTEVKWEFAAALDLLGQRRNVLEVGVGAGYFLKAARDRGYSIQGVELSSSAAARARAMDFKIHETTLDELKSKIDLRFDAICAFQVLEHVPDPLCFIKGMIDMLTPGGTLILSVPNSAVIKKIDLHNQSLLNQPPHHMGHWDAKVFQCLEQIMPLRLKSIHREPLSGQHIDWIVVGYLRNFFSFIGPTLARLLINRYSTSPLKWAMKAGLRRYFPGHTLLVEFEKRE
ncbi:methyltransferase domain-containing protein [Rhodobacterales bacterium HKCCD6035]|nr:methyltransferase domain-containing protein [Rhodobacterales bacterium HKCCD6035]